MLFSYADAIHSPGARLLVRSLEAVTGATTLRRRYEQLGPRLANGANVWTASLELLDVSLRLSGYPLDQLPRSGPLVVVVNHPFGLIDGIAACHLVSQVRSDYRLIAIHLLSQLPEISELILPIDFSQTEEAKNTNLSSRAEAVRRLRAGECIIMFPAGQVAASRRLFGVADESPWHAFVGRLIQATGAAVLPIHFAGQNSWMFNLATRLGWSARLAMFVRETRRLIGSTIDVTIGSPLGRDELASHERRSDLVSFLRSHTLRLPEIRVESYDRRKESPSRPTALNVAV